VGGTNYAGGGDLIDFVYVYKFDLGLVVGEVFRSILRVQEQATDEIGTR